MATWVHEHLDRKIADSVQSATRDDNAVRELLAEAAGDRLEIEAAQGGNIDPLRKKYPHLAAFLFPPKLRRGQRWSARKPKIPDQTPELAALIREIWREHYGRQNRKPEDGYSAEEIALMYLSSIGLTKNLAPDR